MAITLNLKASADRFYGAWVRRGRPAFMQSEQYHLLSAAIRLYLQGGNSGLSFLIAGQRGAGKTALVNEVVEAITDKLIEDWDTWASEPRGPLPAERQRPLLVRLHGPSLGKQPQGSGDSDDTEAGTEAGPQASTASGRTARRRRPAGPGVEVNVYSSPPAKPEAGGRPPSASSAQAVLVQIMIALYRALANEVGEAAAARALDSGRQSPALEFAAQLRFDLDRAAGPETLRDLWEEIEPRRCGFLWPKKISEALAATRIADQHFREIVAVAAAAQAFQVCSGDVTLNQMRKDSLTHERSVELKAGFDAKDAINRLIALSAGGLLGYGIAGAAGAGVGLFGSLGATTFSRRSAKRERTEDYTFVVDRSVQSLERDLPLVIERIRAAGLAPVFIVDELDKAPLTGDDSVSELIGTVINRFKHITTDYGFFCFLTGPDYLNDVERALADRTYPIEHTYFSERLLIGYEPADFDAYGTAVVLTPEDATPQDRFARYALVRELTLASHLNTIDFRRKLRRLEADLRPNDEGRPLRANGSNQQLLAVSVQLAIDSVLERAREAKLVASNPGFWQIAFDVLYRVVRLWERDVDEIDMSRQAIAQDLLHRRGGKQPVAAKAVAAAQKEIGTADFDTLCKMAEDLARCLREFSDLFTQISDAGAPHAWNRQVFESLKSRAIVRLLRRVGKTSRYQFLFARDGADRLGIRPFEGLHWSLRRSRWCRSELAAVGLTVDDLQVLDWPSALSAADIDAAVAGLSDALDAKNLQAAGTAAGPLDQFLDYIRISKNVLDNAAALCADVAREARLGAEPLRLSPVVASLARHVPDPNSALETRPLPNAFEPMTSGDLLPADFAAIDIGADDREPHAKWSDGVLQRARETPRAELASRAERAWIFWLASIHAFLSYGVRRSGDGRPQFNDLVLTAGGRLPSRVLRYNLLEVDDFEWTELALAAIASQWGGSETAEFAPAWAALAGLHRLGFGRQSLEILRIQPQRGSGALTTAQIESFLPTSDAKPGIVVIAPRPLPERPTHPYLLVTEATLERYELELAWLRKIGMIDDGVFQRD